jgi:hypothetical protein
MKITGYTIIFFLLGILLICGFINFEMWMYNKFIISKKSNKDDIILFYMLHLIILLIICAILDINTNVFKKLDKLLKKRLL